MSPAWIRKRKSAKGETRHQVVYRRGGRETTVQSAGTFPRDREARLRRDLVAGWLAQGLDPKVELAKLREQQTPPRSFTAAAKAMLRTRHDLDDSTIMVVQMAVQKVERCVPDLAAKPPERWTVEDAQQLVARLVETRMAPSSISTYMSKVRQVFDFCGLTPNVTRDRRVKLPVNVRPEPVPPSAREVLAIIGRTTPMMRLAIVTLEQTAMRVGELCSLPWGDVDVAGSRFRLSRERTKTRHPRWVQVPEWLMGVICDTCPLEDRAPTRRVFPVGEDGVLSAMARACRAAGIPVYSPHDLRHRRASLWHGQGVPVRELMQRGGWRKSDIAIETYSHVMPLDELDLGALEELLQP